jgi:hypothetical protein
MSRASNWAVRKRKTKINLEHHLATHEREKAVFSVEQHKTSNTSSHSNTAKQSDHKTTETIGPYRWHFYRCTPLA